MSGERRDTEAELEAALDALAAGTMPAGSLIEIRAPHVEAPRSATTAYARHTPSVGTAVSTNVGVAASAHSATTTRPTSISCPTCNGPVDVATRHVAVHQGAVRLYCSSECLEARDALPIPADAVAIAEPRKRRRVWWLAALLVPAGFAGYVTLYPEQDPALVPPPPAIATTHPISLPSLEEPEDPQREADARLIEELSRDAWIHPLAGPKRRMPRNHSGAFGAERPGERPPECVSGHCGVDLGYNWGEPIYAVHEGVIDYVNRGPNEERGGIFVRISHRNGTLFSWYFHLAAVPKWIKPGVKVTAGTMIGLVGDTGIKHSKPHLHFALSVKPSKHARERYLDPEPLLAIWPLWIPNESGTGGVVSTAFEPGLPVRGVGKKRPKRKQVKEASVADVVEADTSSAAAGVASDAVPANASR